MAKLPYTIECLSQSSSGTSSYARLVQDMECLRNLVGQVHLDGTQSNVSLPSGTAMSVGGNGQASGTLQRPVSTRRPRAVQEEFPQSDSDSVMSPGSVYEESTTPRPRTNYSREQLQELEKAFRQDHYIGPIKKQELAMLLNLKKKQIKIWFQNRRMKDKRIQKDQRFDDFLKQFHHPYFNSSNYTLPCYPVRPDLHVPLPPIHPHYGAPPPAFYRPTFNAPPVASRSLGYYQPCLPMMVPPNNPLYCRFSPY